MLLKNRKLSGRNQQICINKIKHIWVEYGEMNYEDAMDRNETIRYLESKGFFLITSLSSYTSAGDLLFVNKGMN